MSAWWRRRKGPEPSGAGADEPGPAGRPVLGLWPRREAARMRTVDDLVDQALEPPRPFPDAQAAADRVLSRLRQLRDRGHRARG